MTSSPPPGSPPRYQSSVDPWYSPPFPIARKVPPPGPLSQTWPDAQQPARAPLVRCLTSPAVPTSNPGLRQPKKEVPADHAAPNDHPISGPSRHAESALASATLSHSPPQPGSGLRVHPKEEADPFWVQPYKGPRPPSGGKTKAVNEEDTSKAFFRRFDGKQASFLVKLFAILEQPEYHSILRWDDDGRTIIIERPDELAKTILPLVFRQSKFVSFSRQLNIYGFMRKVSLRNMQSHITHPDASTWTHGQGLNRKSTRQEIEGYKRRVPPRHQQPIAARRLAAPTFFPAPTFLMPPAEVPSPASSPSGSEQSFYAHWHHPDPYTQHDELHGVDASSSMPQVQPTFAPLPQAQHPIIHPRYHPASMRFAPKPLHSRLQDRRSSVPTLPTTYEALAAPSFTPSGPLQPLPALPPREELEPLPESGSSDEAIAFLLPQSAPAVAGQMPRNVLVQQARFRTRSDQGEPLSAKLVSPLTPLFPAHQTNAQVGSPAGSEGDPFHNPPFWNPGGAGAGDTGTPGSDISDIAMWNNYGPPNSSSTAPLSVHMLRNDPESLFPAVPLGPSIPAPPIPDLGIQGFGFPLLPLDALTSANSTGSGLSSAASSSFGDTSSSPLDLAFAPSGHVDPKALHLFPNTVTPLATSAGSSKPHTLFKHLSSPHLRTCDRRPERSPSRAAQTVPPVWDARVRSAPYPSVAQSLPGRAIPRMGVPGPAEKRRSSLANVYCFGDDVGDDYIMDEL